MIKKQRQTQPVRATNGAADRRTHWHGLFGAIVLAGCVLACSPQSDIINTSTPETDTRYEASVTRLQQPVVIPLAVNNRPSKSTLRATPPGYEDVDLSNPTINTNSMDRVHSLLVSELSGNDYKIIPGPRGRDNATNGKVKRLNINDDAPKLELKAIPADGIITLYANVVSPADNQPFIYGKNGPRNKNILNEHHFIDFETENTWHIISLPNYDRPKRNIEPDLGRLSASINNGTPTLFIPMSMRLYNCAALGGNLYASYEPDGQPELIDIIFLKRVFAKLKLSFQYPKAGEKWQYRAYKFFNYPHYFSYLEGDFDQLKKAPGFDYSDGNGFNNTGQADFFNRQFSHIDLFLPENDPTKAEEELKIKIRVAKNKAYPSVTGVTYDLPIGVKQSNGLHKITRNESYEATVVVHPDAVEVYYKIVPFDKKEVWPAAFE